ncbi:MAG: DUF3795 domain-containing protein [Promethearchaeota archaeon]
MTFDKDKLIASEIAILGKCGVFCPACDAYIGLSKKHAKEIFNNLGIDERKVKESAENLLTVMEQFNYDDGVGSFVIGIPIKQYKNFKKILRIIAKKAVPSEENPDYGDFKDFQRVLRKFVNSPNCIGCGTGIGPAKTCPIVFCCEERGFITCVECPDIQNHLHCKTVLEKQIQSMITDNCTYFKLITRRHMYWNVENLKTIIKKGYKEYIEEMKEKVKKGFNTGQVISKEFVFKDLLGF